MGVKCTFKVRGNNTPIIACLNLTISSSKNDLIMDNMVNKKITSLPRAGVARREYV